MLGSKVANHVDPQAKEEGTGASAAYLLPFPPIPVSNDGEKKSEW